MSTTSISNQVDPIFKNPKRTIKLATVFSGIGSVEYAFRRLGLNSEIVFACDNDKFVKQSYFANYSITEDSWFDDVQNIDGTKFKNQVYL